MEGNDLEECPLKKVSINRGIDLLRRVGTMGLNIKIRHEACKVPTPLPTMDHKNTKDALRHSNDRVEKRDNHIIRLCIGIIFYFNDSDNEIAQIEEDCTLTKSRANDEEMEFRDFSAMPSTRAEKLE